MFRHTKAFSSFSVDDIDKAKEFYGHTLGINYFAGYGQLHLHFPGGNNVFLYTKPDHQPASHTVLNFPVDDIEKICDELKEKGVDMLSYPELEANCDERKIYSGSGPRIAWFNDPAGNILSIIEQS
ncbi:VOC family protein [Candidatus Saccharibacteria bacterium]|nr:VOC family protein [Candidatus Saccharibacteria bacterium]